MMMREYVFDKKINDTMKESILKDVKELDRLEHVEITDDMQHIVVGAEDEDYPMLMTKILNTYCKYSRGNLISFTRFI